MPSKGTILNVIGVCSIAVFKGQKSRMKLGVFRCKMLGRREKRVDEEKKVSHSIILDKRQGKSCVEDMYVGNT